MKYTREAKSVALHTWAEMLYSEREFVMFQARIEEVNVRKQWGDFTDTEQKAMLPYMKKPQ